MLPPIKLVRAESLIAVSGPARFALGARYGEVRIIMHRSRHGVNSTVAATV